MFLDRHGTVLLNRNIVVWFFSSTVKIIHKVAFIFKAGNTNMHTHTDTHPSVTYCLFRKLLWKTEKELCRSELHCRVT